VVDSDSDTALFRRDMSPSTRWDDDDDSKPSYRGSRNYEGFGSSMSDTIGDAFDSVKRAAAQLKENMERQFQESFSNEAQKANSTVLQTVGEDGQDRAVEPSKSKDEDRHIRGMMPEGCFCYLRGYSCTLHNSQESWRLQRDFQKHIHNNLDPKHVGEHATILASGDAAVIQDVADANATDATDATELSAAMQASKSSGMAPSPASEHHDLDEVMAQLIEMGFEPNRVASVLERHPTLVLATSAMLELEDSEGDAETPQVSSDISSPPSQPLPTPLPMMQATPPTSPAAAPPPEESTSSHVNLHASVPQSMPAPVPSAAGPVQRLAPPGSVGVQSPNDTVKSSLRLAQPQINQPHAASVLSSPTRVATHGAENGVSNGGAALRFMALPTGWHACHDPRTGCPYWFHTGTQWSQWTYPCLGAAIPDPGSTPGISAQTAASGFPLQLPLNPTSMSSTCAMAELPARSACAIPCATAGCTTIAAPPTASSSPVSLNTSDNGLTAAAAAAASAPPSFPPKGLTGTLPAGWHECVDQTHNRSYWFNTVTKQSQWTLPTAAAAIPLPAMPFPEASLPPNPTLPAAELGGVSDMAASYGLPLHN